MSKEPVVLFLPKWYPNKFDPLDGNFVENHARAINKYAKIAIIFVHSDPELQLPFQLEESRPFGYPEIRVYFKKANFGLSGINKIVNVFRYIKAQWMAYGHYQRKYPPVNLCHLHILRRTAPLALYLKFVHRIPYLITEHWSGYHRESGAYRGWLMKLAGKIAVKYAEKVTTVTEGLKNSMLRHGLKNDYVIIPNSVNTSVFKPNPIPSPKKTKRLIHISNLSQTPKNMPQIIRTLEDLCREGLEFEFVLIGDGEDRKKIMEQIKASPLSERTLYKGELSMKKVAKELADSDLLILFSQYENQPCVILEALACGVPVVSSAVGGIPQILNREGGILVEKGDLLGFKGAIRSFLKGKNHFSSSQLRKHAKQHFGEEVVGKAFLKEYLEIIQ